VALPPAALHLFEAETGRRCMPEAVRQAAVSEVA
jgi:hypothetical protein